MNKLRLLMTLLLMVQGALFAADWPQFRGVNRDGVSSETDLLNAWPENGPKELWRVPLGPGYSAVSSSKGKLYTMYGTEVEGKATEVAACFDPKNGQQIWQTALSEQYDTEFGNGPRSTPIIHNGTVIVLSARGDLAMLSADKGEVIWKKNLPETFGCQIPRWGFATTGIVDGDLLLIQTGGPEGKAMAGLKLDDGSTAWSFDNSMALYNSPLAFDWKGKTHYVSVVWERIVCFDREGNEVWDTPWPKGETHAMPIFIPPNKLYVSGAQPIGAKLFELQEKDGSVELQEKWAVKSLRNHFSSSVYHEGYLYGFDNATLKCISVEDGSLKWSKRRLGKGSLIFADNMLYVLSDQGKLLFIEATPEAYREKGAVQALKGRCWTMPTLSQGKLYLRSHDEMVCYDVKG